VNNASVIATAAIVAAPQLRAGGMLVAWGVTCAWYGKQKYSLPWQQAALRILGASRLFIYCATYTQIRWQTT